MNRFPHFLHNVCPPVRIVPAVATVFVATVAIVFGTSPEIAPVRQHAPDHVSSHSGINSIRLAGVLCYTSGGPQTGKPEVC